MRKIALIFACVIISKSFDVANGKIYRIQFDVQAAEPSVPLNISVLNKSGIEKTIELEKQKKDINLNEICRPLIEKNDLKRLKGRVVGSESPLSDTPSCLLPSQIKSSLKTIYVITSTHRRPEQVPELIRLSHTLMLVENVVWLVIEDYKRLTKQVRELLDRSKLKFEHLQARTLKEYDALGNSQTNLKQDYTRDRGLAWIRENATNGVVYFADDAGTYDLEIFTEIRKTKKLSMFPVGLGGVYGVSTPIIKNGVLTGYYDGWRKDRKYQIDMAGFAVDVKFLKKRPNAKLSGHPSGLGADGFLKSLEPFDSKEIEFLAGGCTSILIWRTESKPHIFSKPTGLMPIKDSNIEKLRHDMN